MEHFMPHLAESIKTGKHLDLYAWLESQPEVSGYFQEGMIQLARFISKDLDKALQLPPHAKRVLDVGGGHGEYSIALCKRHPALSAVIFDSEQALVTGTDAIAKAGLSDRITTHQGNFMIDALPQGFDVALVFNIVHGLSPDENITLFQNIKKALNDGGKVVVLEQVHGISPLPYQTAVTHILSLAYFHLVGGQVYTAEEIEGWMRQAGFQNSTRKRIVQAGSVLISAK